jgi:hypothetical protein
MRILKYILFAIMGFLLVANIFLYGHSRGFEMGYHAGYIDCELGYPEGYSLDELR